MKDNYKGDCGGFAISLSVILTNKEQKVRKAEKKALHFLFLFITRISSGSDDPTLLTSP